MIEQFDEERLCEERRSRVAPYRDARLAKESVARCELAAGASRIGPVGGCDSRPVRQHRTVENVRPRIDDRHRTTTPAPRAARNRTTSSSSDVADCTSRIRSAVDAGVTRATTPHGRRRIMTLCPYRSTSPRLATPPSVRACVVASDTASSGRRRLPCITSGPRELAPQAGAEAASGRHPVGVRRKSSRRAPVACDACPQRRTRAALAGRS